VVEVATPDELRERGTDQVYLTLASTPTTVPDLDVDGIVDIRLEESTLVVTAQGGGRIAPDLLRELEYEGHDVLDLDIRRASLEEVFVDMTRTDEAAEPMGVPQ
jgi:ABC-2 type transport system ATP-binding protein